MARVAIFNQKGGVGKTTTTLNLSAALSRRGNTPLSIDLDPQAHLSAITGTTVANSDHSISAFSMLQKPLADLVKPGLGGWPVIPAHLELSKERFGDELCETRISESVSVAESPASNMDVFAHAPGGRGAKDYDALLDELMAGGFLP